MKKALYTVTSGRSGTAYLTELLRENLNDAEVFHERTGFPHFGVNTPDASHATTFNHVGNVAHVQRFWREKLQRDAGEEQTWFADISHHLAKAGLVENIELLLPHRQVFLVLLRRDPFSIAWSYINRFEFVNNGFTWLFSLDANYPRKIIDAKEFAKQGVFGKSIWYFNEVFARQAYYRELLSDVAGVTVLHANLSDISRPAGAAKLLEQLTGEVCEMSGVIVPPSMNASKQVYFNDNVKRDIKKLFENLWIDPDTAGWEYFQSGRRLGAAQY